ncbi:MAG TPA: hypothetical protein VIL77_02705 [Gaiellaceae bacterium]
MIVLVAGGAAAVAATSNGSRTAVHVGCPPQFSFQQPQASLIDGAIAAARTVVIDHRTETNQGRVSKRTPTNYYLSQVMDLSRSRGTLFRAAARRCGAEVAGASWALVFHDGESLIATNSDVRFAVRLKNGWWVY